jgi:hypothetical protein
MTIVLIIVAAIALALLAFKFIRGMTKLVVLGVVVLLALFILHQAGGF